ncbi:uncharacterized protein IL334_000312 [Kwoniella shivajii]|uniref:GH16 domain-containing protein n=1 Tax=Kwoniella shivajii TaxID=564305 RepID=A0ABZ1CPX2_9TREE|nr:hypothetical protein IL334_000312 [Kwoniella shivajii]
MWCKNTLYLFFLPLICAIQRPILPYHPDRALLPLMPHFDPSEFRSEAYSNDKRGDIGRRMYSQDEITSWTGMEKDKRQLKWERQISYEGKTFFDGWDFFTQPDPTLGLVTYVDNMTAFGSGLAFWTGDGKPGIQVDHFKSTPVGTPQNSVRINTKAMFAGGLFIIDLALMPWGCGVWPAFWTLGYNGEWPSTGEIDIIEGIQAMTNNHTLPGCEINQSPGMYTGSLGNTVCDSTTGGSGCTIVSSSDSSFGMPFNAAGGGVFAMLWTGDGIRMWDWNRAQIPSDIKSDTPDPTTWGTSRAAWDASTCDPGKYFQAQVLVLNIDLCGVWAGALYSSYPYCPGTCAEYISDPKNLNNTVMLLNYIKVYQQSGTSHISEQAQSNSNLTGAGGNASLNASEINASVKTTKTSTDVPGTTGTGNDSSKAQVPDSAHTVSCVFMPFIILSVILSIIL